MFFPTVKGGYTFQKQFLTERRASEKVTQIK